jgi:hypothetical protein
MRDNASSPAMKTPKEMNAPNAIIMIQAIRHAAVMSFRSPHGRGIAHPRVPLGRTADASIPGVCVSLIDTGIASDGIGLPTPGFWYIKD